MEYHLFENNKVNYIYFPMYKQFFEMSTEEAKTVKGKLENYQVMLKSFIDGVELEEEYEYSKDHRYGLFLNIANACNAKCTYCFAHQGDYGKERGLMKKEIARKALNKYMDYVPDYAQANIIFFGGEPMMAFDIIEDSVDYIKQKFTNKNFKFHIVTNGTLLSKERIDFFSNNNFSMAISIDGGEDMQNTQRPLANGANSFTAVTKNLSYLLEKIDNIHARGTYCDFSQSLVKNYEDLISIGFKEVHIPPDILNANMNQDFNKLLNELDKLYDYVVKYINNHDDFPFGLFVEQFRRLFLPRKDTNYSCGLGKTNFAADINGNIYPCHRFTSEDDYLIGNVEQELKSADYDFSQAKCKDCWNRYTCSHGCAYNDLILSESIEKKNPFWCAYSKKMTELTMRLVTELSDEQVIRIMNI